MFSVKLDHYNFILEKQFKSSVHRKNKYDIDDDYIDPRDTDALAAAAAKPSNLTLFDALKSKLNIEGYKLINC
jgi:hypothetical protein